MVRNYHQSPAIHLAIYFCSSKRIFLLKKILNKGKNYILSDLDVSSLIEYFVWYDRIPWTDARMIRALQIYWVSQNLPQICFASAYVQIQHRFAVNLWTLSMATREKTNKREGHTNSTPVDKNNFTTKSLWYPKFRL